MPDQQPAEAALCSLTKADRLQRDLNEANSRITLAESILGQYLTGEGPFADVDAHTVIDTAQDILQGDLERAKETIELLEGKQEGEACPSAPAVSTN